MTTSKRAAAHELREKKTADIKAEMQALYDRLMKEPCGVDFGTEWERLESGICGCGNVLDNKKKGKK